MRMRNNLGEGGSSSSSSANASVDFASKISSQVSPQISPIFIQQQQPTNSGINANASMTGAPADSGGAMPYPTTYPETYPTDSGPVVTGSATSATMQKYLPWIIGGLGVLFVIRAMKKRAQ